MKNLIYAFILLFVLIPPFVQTTRAQESDNQTNACSKHMTSPFVSDGQEYRAFISRDETAEFRVTFYGGSTYRIVACTGNNDNNIVFTLYDKERNELYSSRDFNNAPYWDFQFNSSVDCIIEVQMADAGTEPGLTIVSIGFIP